MLVRKHKIDVAARVDKWKKKQCRIALVPTMGALHCGHMNLVESAVNECDHTVVSIYLNPTQFGEKEDLDKYPVNLERDLDMLDSAGVDLAFTPNSSEMYPEAFSTWVIQEKFTETLCGNNRPGHFRGVCTVVAKLFNIVSPDYSYFGRKDFQQSVVIKRMVKDLDFQTSVRVMPTVREKDGLAMSSRNQYLTTEQRRHAVVLHDALLTAREYFEKGRRDTLELVKIMQDEIENEDTVIPEYVEIVDAESLDTPPSANEKSVAALAAHVGCTRLIDNMPLGGENEDIYLASPSCPVPINKTIASHITQC